MNRLTALLLALLLFLPPALTAGAEGSADPVSMLCLNVGKGDAILLTIGDLHYLVDTGYKRTADKLMEMLSRENVTHLNGVFLTHNHKDHYGGLDRLAKSKITIDAFYTPAYCLDGIDAGHPAVQAAARRGQTVQLLQGGNVIEASDTARFTVLGPTVLNKNNENNNSLVMRLDTALGSILLTGDMKSEEEYILLKSGVLAPVDVLKVPFHGDDTACGSAFLNAVRPRVGVISTSTEEEPDTPSRDTLRRLAVIGCETYVTQDAKDAVLVTLTGETPTVRLIDWTGNADSD
ncbi:MAG: MBL fold metallo-hydrolase [Clostridia bacterium]|nr:MBL fold metallo-hydrolase [Clostridia bacterium]